MANNEKTKIKIIKKWKNVMPTNLAHQKKSNDLYKLNMFLTNGTGVGQADPRRVAEWNRFIAVQRNQNRIG